MKKSRGYSFKLLSLLSTAGVAIAPAAMIGATSVLLAPATALAANECITVGVDPGDNGAATDSFVCDSSIVYSGTGITYSSNGPLIITGTNTGSVGTVGINLTGNTSDSITWTQTAGVITGTGGPVFDVTSGTGAINISTTGITGTASAVTYGILATSTSGAITITDSGTININTNTSPSQIAAISASTAGAITITTNSVTGRQYGIQATGGGGAVAINANGAVSTSTQTGVTVAAISASNTGSGTINVSLGGTSGTVNGQAGTAILTSSGTGNQTITVGSGRTAQVTTASTTGALNLSSTGAKTVTNSGSITGGGTSGTAILVNSGTTFTLNNNSGATVTGRVGITGTSTATVTNAGTLNLGSTGLTTSGTNTNLTVTNNAGGSISGLINNGGTGTTTITNNASLSNGTGSVVLQTAGTNVTINNNAAGTLSGRLALSGSSGTTTMNNAGTWNTSGASAFTAGTSTLTNSGTLNAGAATTFTSLETFNNSGTIALGLNTLDVGGASFVASGNSLVTLTIGSTSSGLLDLSGSTVSGVTSVQLNAADTTAFADPVVVIDVTGGTVDETNFVLSGDTVVSDSGSFFGRTLAYNGMQQFVALSVPTTLALEYVPALQEALSAWHTTADVVNGRNTDMRNRDRGMWIRVAGDRSERDFMPTVAGLDYDASYSTYTGTAIVGFDVLADSSASGDYYLGISGGLVRTRMEFDNSETTDDMDGVTLGVYGGISNGGLTFDGLFGVNLLNLDHNEPINGDTSTNVISIGGRGEVGYVWQLSEAFYVQPIVTGAYVRTTIDEMFPGTTEVDYDEIESARAAAGLRIGADAGTVMGPVGFWLTGRLWKEFKDESNVTFRSDGAPDFVFYDDLSGEFQELSGGLTLDTDWADFYVSAGAKFYEHDEYDNYNGSVGVRWTW